MNLASVQRIESLSPIVGADIIEKATVLGWELVVKKGEYNVGDLTCYIQIDTVVPETPEFEFLRQRNFRVRTIKLRNQISQGLLVPLPKGNWKVGDDLTDVIGVKKYEKPDNNPGLYEKIPKKSSFLQKFKFNVLYKLFPSLRKKLRSDFPKHLVSITDEPRIQNMPQVLESHKGKEFIVSYKLDGSSITIIHDRFLGKSRFRVCSRRFELHDKENDWYKVFKTTNFEKHIKTLVGFYNTNNIIVQGEAIGKFNGNHHNLKQNEIRLFNIYVNGKRINQKEFKGVCETFDIPYCPVLGVVELNHTMEEILKMSELPDILNPKTNLEGLVWRCVEDNLSFKVINNNYLLKNED
jgi:hypothetical protein